MEKFKCPSCDHIAEAEGECPVHHVALVKMEAEPAGTEQEGSQDAPSDPAPADGSVSTS